ncbi:hypothetical protein EVAR_81483_1 [Eumeta japonica]|uniref:Uncharacterized protein n=1 Tax=Eumeta variegata TaxID=151549 RepID=A0A4C1W3P3_EUMVA|nr:hypothetical protein EVAR_81483_1 [Eumeta japonica]
MVALAEDLHFNIVTPLTPTHYPSNDNLEYHPHEKGSFEIKIITNWQQVSSVLEEIDTPTLNSISNDIVSIDDIDNAIGALTNYIRIVVDDSSRVVPANSDCKELLAN